MKTLTTIIFGLSLIWGSWVHASENDEIKQVDSCLDAYSAHIKGQRWTIIGGSTGFGVLICMTPGILIYPFVSSTLTSVNENKLSKISDGRQLLSEAQINTGKRLDGFVAEVIKGCGHDVAAQDITDRINKLEEDSSYCRKSMKDGNGKNIVIAEPWTYNEILTEMIAHFK
jgi:hypothetical protein